MSAQSKKDGIWFSITIENEEFIAFICSDVLCSHFKAGARKEQALRAAYNANQQRIHAVARRKFFSGAPRPVRLSVTDF